MTLPQRLHDAFRNLLRKPRGSVGKKAIDPSRDRHPAFTALSRAGPSAWGLTIPPPERTTNAC